ncbi:MAG: hypothetical protein KDA75_18375, partial [Planctomycetaceae bacterium]|nr:hypothetical protein [Planctomycetaceae bacterium]
RHQYRQLKPGSGRWRWWCCGMLGEELGVEPVLYAELQAQWPELCDRMGIPPVPLQHVNGFGRAENIEWTPDLHRWVNSVFADDIQRFGFRVPEHITV